jgi:hypothetical protein
MKRPTTVTRLILAALAAASLMLTGGHAKAATQQTCTAHASVFQVQGSSPPKVRFRSTLACSQTGDLYVYSNGFKDGNKVGQLLSVCGNDTYCDVNLDVTKSFGTHQYQDWAQGGDDNYPPGEAYDTAWSSIWTGTR